MRKLLIPIVVLVAVFAGYQLLSAHNDTDTNPSRKQTTQKPATRRQDGFNKQQYSLTDPTSQWVVVNKHRPLSPQTYVPADLTVPSVPLRLPGGESMQVRKVTADALQSMFATAQTAGTPLLLSSGYRSYTYQVSLYSGYVRSQGQQQADAESARPGYSEHQTGLAADVAPLDKRCDVQQCFASTPAGQWLAANAYKYGFIIRYPQDATSVTGYAFEPWHIRYVGVGLATELHDQHVETLEQFFGLGAAPSYN